MDVYPSKKGGVKALYVERITLCARTKKEGSSFASASGGIMCTLGRNDNLALGGGENDPSPSGSKRPLLYQRKEEEWGLRRGRTFYSLVHPEAEPDEALKGERRSKPQQKKRKEYF